MRKNRRARFWLAGTDEDIESVYPAPGGHRETWQAECARRSLEAMNEADWRAAFARNPARSYEKQELLPPPPRFMTVSGGDDDEWERERRRPSWAYTYLLLCVVTGVLLAPVMLGALPWPVPHLRGIIHRKTLNLPHSPSAARLDKWMRAEAGFAYRRVLDNIGPAAGVPDGVVIASPSTGGGFEEPDYFYTWTRDAALTVSSLLPELLPETYLSPWEGRWHTDAPLSRVHKRNNPLLEGLVRSYASFQAHLQSTPNPSGNLWTGGLAEPKFEVDGTAFTGSWGRPQRDGPALRALALIPYAHWLLDRGFPADIAYVRESLYDPHSLRHRGSVVKNDLEEVANSWRKPGFDLWEEVDGNHLFTDAVSRRALQAGAGLAARLGDEHASVFYSVEAEHIAERMAAYRVAEGWRATEDPGSRNGLDAAILLAAIHTGSGSVEEDLAPHDPAVLASLRSYVRSFEGMYSQNTGNWTDGWLVGRYAEDVYDGVGFTGGNPWYITTFAVATTLYRAQRAFAEAGIIRIEPAAGNFWADLDPALDMSERIAGLEHWEAGSAGFERAMAALSRVADAFVTKAARTVRNGRMSEQISRDGRGQRGARDLTWSYAAFLDVKRARDAARTAWAGARDLSRAERAALRRPRGTRR